jgi:unsaturated chondroitin disaccharide hydrolase
MPLFKYSPYKTIMSDHHNALHSLLTRLNDIDSQCAAGFPLYSIGNNSEWLISQSGSWMGGFWTGCWWLRAHLTQSTADYAKAVALCEKLSDKIQLDSSYRSLIFWYGAAVGDVWFRNDTARHITIEAATALATSYDSHTRCVPLGTALGAGTAGQRIITVDGLAALIDLLTYSGDSEQAAIARQHTNTLIDACLTKTGAFHAEAQYVDGYFQATDRAGDWSRGHAWAMLGLTHAAQQWGEPYLTMARSACDYWCSSRPEPLPLNRLSEPSGLQDASATVIASLAMLSLAEQVTDSEQWRDLAAQQLNAIVQSEYVNNGIFSGCCYKIKPQQIINVESSWGLFLLMLAFKNLINLSSA